MIESLRSIISGLFIAIGVFISPVKEVAPVSQPEVSVIATPEANIETVITPEPTFIPSPTKKECQFNKEQMTNLMMQYGYSNEDIIAFFQIRPGNCFNINSDAQVPININSEINTQLNEQKMEDLDNCNNQLEQYSDCIEQYNQELEDYYDSLDPGSWRYGMYTSKPYNSCFKPACYY